MNLEEILKNRHEADNYGEEILGKQGAAEVAMIWKNNSKLFRDMEVG